MKRIILVLLTAVLYGQAFAGSLQSLALDTDYYDLDSGTIHTSFTGPPLTDWDFRISADPFTYGAYLLDHNPSYAIAAHLPGRSFGSVTFADVATAPFSGAPIGDAFQADSVFIVNTYTGRFFKIGNLVVDTNTWTCQVEVEELLPPPPPTRDAYLAVDADYLDLDGPSFDRGFWGVQPPNPSWDLHFLPHPSLVDTFTIEQNTTNWVSVAHLPGRDYATVDSSDLQTALFDTMVQQTPVGAGDTFLIQTEQGRFFKLGNIAYDWWTYALYFDYQELTPTPPAGMEYLTVESDYLDLDIPSVDRGYWGVQPPNPSWDLHFLPHPSLIDTFTIEQNTFNWVSVAHLPGRDYATVDSSDLQTAFFDTTVQQTPVAAGDTFLIQTDQGRFFKLGNIAYDWWTYAIYFDYQELTPAPPAGTEYLTVESDYLDLDIPSVDRGYWGVQPPNPSWDLHFLPHPSLVDTFTIEQNTINWVSVAHLPGRDYAEVDSSDLQTALFDSMVQQTPVGAGDTFLILTDQGRFFKLGNIAYDWWTYALYFDYQELTPTPPTGMEYLTVESDYLDLDTPSVDRGYWSVQPPNPSWDLHFLPHPSLVDTFTIEQNTINWVSVAHLPGRDYAEVDSSDLQTAFFDSMVQQTPVAAGDTFLIQTDQGRFFKLGNLAWDWWSYALYFDYQELTPAPPAGTEYLAIDADYLDLDIPSVDRGYWGVQPPNPSWDLHFLPHPSLVDTFTIEQNTINWVSVAHLPGRDYAEVDSSDLQTAFFDSMVQQTPVAGGDTFLIQTEQGRFFKLGNFVYDWWSYALYFDYEELLPRHRPRATSTWPSTATGSTWTAARSNGGSGVCSRPIPRGTCTSCPIRA